MCETSPPSPRPRRLSAMWDGSPTRYGSIFLMPPLFAQICLEKPAAKVVIPRSGALAEPMLLYQKPVAPAKEKVRGFFDSAAFRELMADYQMPAIGDNRFRIEKSCWKLATEEELEIVFHAFHKK